MFLLGLLNGIVTGLVYSAEELWWCIFFCMIPFAGMMLSKQGKMAFVMGYGMGYHVTGLAFLLKLAKMLPLPCATAYVLMSAAILLAGLILTAVFAAAFYPFMHRRSCHGADIFLMAGFYILAEWLQGLLPVMPFPWFRLATVLAEKPLLIQGASISGTLFVDFLIVLWNGLLARLMICRRAEGAAWVAALLLGGVLLYSDVRLYEENADGDATVYRVMLVQGSHEGRSKWAMEISDILRDYTELMREGMEKNISLVVLPETALPYSITDDTETVEQLLSFCREYNTELLAGAIEEERAEERYNAVYHVTADGVSMPAYRKQILVPFGEYLPFTDVAEKLCPWFKEFMTGNVFEAGEETIVFDTQAGKTGMLICFESVFSQTAAEAVNEGAGLLAVVSNDAWFTGTPALRQHHAHAVLRAVETDRYVIRAANTGISSVTDNRGRVRAALPENSRGVLKYPVVCSSGRTLYSVTGDVLPAVFLLFYAAVTIKKACILIFSYLSAIIKR